MTDWIEHDGGPQPVDDDVWVEAQWPFSYFCAEGRYFSVEPDEMEQASELPWEGNKLRYRILNQHLIDAKQAEIDALRDDLETWQSVFPHVMPDRLKSDQQLADEDVAAKIDAARLEGIRLGLEAAARLAEEESGNLSTTARVLQGFHSQSSATVLLTDKGVGSAIRALNPDTIAEEAQRD